MLKSTGQLDGEESLAIRAAWLHYAGGLTQSAVAKRLGLPSVKAHRLIARAVADGVVKVTIDGEIVECAKLENQLCGRFGLDFCEVAPDLGEEGLPLRALVPVKSTRYAFFLPSISTISTDFCRSPALTCSS